MGRLHPPISPKHPEVRALNTSQAQQRRGLQAAVLQAQAAAEAADNASRAVALEVREQAIQQAIEAALAHQPVDPPPPQELARAAPAPATPEPPRLRRSR